MPDFDPRPLGALPHDDGVQFRVWAPNADGVDLVLDGEDEGRRPMDDAGSGYFECFAGGLAPGARYRYHLSGEAEPYPDPAGRSQPDGVHSASEVIDSASYDWQTTDWTGVPQKDLAFYELHVGTFSPEGTFAGAQQRLGHLADLGITAIELMPLSAFPGDRNWGYGPASFFAPEPSYGRPRDLRRLVDAAHQSGLAVFLDVIYNHLGPDGAYAAAFAPFFTDKHQTPWGAAVNLDDAGSDGIRHFFFQNALHWLGEYRLDGLRLDATFALEDDSQTHFLEELATRVAGAFDRPKRFLVAEDNRNARHLLDELPKGYGLDGVWADDFHHQMRNLTAGDELGYYADFAGTTTADVARTIRQGWFYTGQHAEHFGRERGTPTDGLAPERFVFCLQNHDQVGNRPAGARLTEDISMPLYRAASAVLLFAPELPLLFMGQEWAASTPFQFFTDHNEELGPLVTKGRKEEFGAFAELAEEVPDPQEEATFQRSKLRWSECRDQPHAGVLALYRDLLHLRRTLPAGDFEAEAHGKGGLLLLRGDHWLLAALANGVTLPLPDGAEAVLHTEEADYTASGTALQFSDEGTSMRFQRPGALVAKSS